MEGAYFEETCEVYVCVKQCFKVSAASTFTLVDSGDSEIAIIIASAWQVLSSHQSRPISAACFSAACGRWGWEMSEVTLFQVPLLDLLEIPAK